VSELQSQWARKGTVHGAYRCFLFLRHFHLSYLITETGSFFDLTYWTYRRSVIQQLYRQICDHVLYLHSSIAMVLAGPHNSPTRVRRFFSPSSSNTLTFFSSSSLLAQMTSRTYRKFSATDAEKLLKRGRSLARCPRRVLRPLFPRTGS
jgi:hypothetical protein